jgi:RNA polymerase sigma factor (sigma-70 family)
MFYKRHAPGILSYCAHRGLAAHDAADATADVFVAALTGRYRFDAERGESASPWLYAIASNVLSGRHRRSGREQQAYERVTREPLPLTDRDLSDYAVRREQVQDALEAISELPPEQRAAVAARHIADSDYVELALSEGITEQVARQRVSRGLGALRKRLGGSDE